MLAFNMFFFLLLSPKVAAELTMMLVWGEPDNMSNCTISNSTTFEACYNECFHEADCIVAFMNASNPICTLCAFQSINEVIQTTNTDNLKCAIKANFSTTCPSSVTDANQVIPGYNATVGLILHSYNLTYTGISWQIQYEEEKWCPPGWKMFDRIMGKWCLLTYYGDDITSWPQIFSQNYCFDHNAVLSGPENLVELEYIVTYYQQYTTPSPVYIRLGAQRSPECVAPKWNSTICNNTLTVYQWKDGFTTGIDGFAWSPDQPVVNFLLPNYATETYETDCVILQTTPDQYGMNTIDCNNYYANDKGFVCGKQPGIEDS